MKQVMYSMLFVLFGVHCQAQNDTPWLTVSANYGITPYEHANGYGTGIQYVYPIGRRMAFSASGGWIQGNYVTSTSSFSYTNREVVTTADLSALIHLAPRANRHDLFLGGGLSLMHTLFNYARYTDHGGTIMERHTTTLPMLHLCLQDHYALTGQWALFGRAIFRSCIQERDVVQRNINDHGFVGTYGGIRHQYSLEVGVSYSLYTRK